MNAASGRPGANWRLPRFYAQTALSGSIGTPGQKGPLGPQTIVADSCGVEKPVLDYQFLKRYILLKKDIGEYNNR